VSKILHIEDVEAIRKMVTIVLIRAGYQVLEAGSIAEAEQLWADHWSSIDLVISDNSLPDGSGVVLLKKLEAQKPGLVIIVSSGIRQSGLPASYMQLAKPFDSQLLLAYVRSALSEP
jgi:DNA-binding NtrC family response regulator